MKTNIYIQCKGNDVLVKDIEKIAKECYKEAGYKASKIKTLDIYYVPEADETYVAITDENDDVVELQADPKENIEE
jgi:hypothetical protein